MVKVRDGLDSFETGPGPGWARQKKSLKGHDESAFVFSAAYGDMEQRRRKSLNEGRSNSSFGFALTNVLAQSALKSKHHWRFCKKSSEQARFNYKDESDMSDIM